MDKPVSVEVGQRWKRTEQGDVRVGRVTAAHRESAAMEVESGNGPRVQNWSVLDGSFAHFYEYLGGPSTAAPAPRMEARAHDSGNMMPVGCLACGSAVASSYHCDACRRLDYVANDARREAWQGGARDFPRGPRPASPPIEAPPQGKTTKHIVGGVLTAEWQKGQRRRGIVHNYEDVFGAREYTVSHPCLDKGERRWWIAEAALWVDEREPSELLPDSPAATPELTITAGGSIGTMAALVEPVPAKPPEWVTVLPSEPLFSPPHMLEPRDSMRFLAGGIFGRAPREHGPGCCCETCVARRERRYGVADLDGDLEDVR